MAESLVSSSGWGLSGINCDSVRESAAMPAPMRKTALEFVTQTIPSRAGSTTAAMWLIVKLMLDVAAMSAGSAIF